MDHVVTGFGAGAPFITPAAVAAVIIIALWGLAWKGLALWRAAKRGDKWWFVILLVLNTAGILEIIYLFAVTGAKLSDITPSKKGASH